MTTQTGSSMTAAGAARDRNFYIGMALACTVTVLVGFAPTYYLKSNSAESLSPLLHLHGAIFTSWLVLLIVQTAFVRADRRDLHRRFGVFGALLVVLMVWVGVTVAIQVVAADVAAGKVRPSGVSPLVFLIRPLSEITVFAALVAFAIVYRRNSEMHKRLMLLATISILIPAIGRMRLQLFGMKGPYFNYALDDLYIVACVLYDYAKRRRVHPAYIWGGLAVVISQQLALAIGRTDTWVAFATWLTS